MSASDFSSSPSTTAVLARSRLLWLGLIAPLLLVSAPATAQDAGHEGPDAAQEGAVDSLAKEADALREELSALVERYRKLEARSQAVEGEDQRVALAQMGPIRIEYLDRLHALVENVLAQEEKSLDARALREEVEAAMRALVPRLGELIVQAGQQLQASRDAMDGAEPALRRELRERALVEMSTVDALYQGMQHHLEDMQRLGLETDAGAAWLRENLTSRADTLAGWVRHVDSRIATLEEALASTPDDAERKQELASEEARLNAVTESLALTLRIMAQNDLPTAEYQKLLVETTGELTGDVLDRDVAWELIRSWSARLRTWVEEHGPGAIFKLLLFLAIMLVTRGIARVTRSIVERAVTTSKLHFSQLLRDTFVSWASKLVTIVGLLFALSQLGIELGPLLAGLGVAGFIVGFALQDTLGNFASGAMILIYRPYDVGDMVDVAGVFGKVSKMSLVATTILTIDNQTLVVPNSKIWGDVIKNVTAQQIRRVDMKFGIAYGDDIEHAEKIFESILADDERVLADPPPMIKLHELGESSVDFVVRPWVKTDDYWDVYWDTTRAVKLRLDAEGLHIPFPQRDVHFHPSDSGS